MLFTKEVARTSAIVRRAKRALACYTARRYHAPASSKSHKIRSGSGFRKTAFSQGHGCTCHRAGRHLHQHEMHARRAVEAHRRDPSPSRSCHREGQRTVNVDSAIRAEIAATVNNMATPAVRDA